jgi:hypothetical protein
MSNAGDRIDDAVIGPLWAKHFPRISHDLIAKTLVLALVYIIEDKAKAKAGAVDGNWLDCISGDSDATAFLRISSGRFTARPGSGGPLEITSRLRQYVLASTVVFDGSAGDGKRRRAMNDTIKPLVVLGFVLFALLALWKVSQAPDRSSSLFNDSRSSVTELGLRFNLQR